MTNMVTALTILKYKKSWSSIQGKAHGEHGEGKENIAAWENVCVEKTNHVCAGLPFWTSRPIAIKSNIADKHTILFNPFSPGRTTARGESKMIIQGLFQIRLAPISWNWYTGVKGNL